MSKKKSQNNKIITNKGINYICNKKARLYLEKNKGSFILYIPYSG